MVFRGELALVEAVDCRETDYGMDEFLASNSLWEIELKVHKDKPVA